MGKELKLDLCWNAFKHSHLFRNLEVHYLRHLSSLATLTYMTPGELIFKKGKFKSKMVYIATGVVQLLSEEDGETPILSLSGGTCLGETALFIDHPSTCTVVCQSYTEVCILERKHFFKSYELYPNEFLQLLKNVFKRYEESKHFVKVNKFQLKNSEWNAKSQVLTMKWLKKTLYRLLSKRVFTGTKSILSTSMNDRIIETTFEKMVFCSKYLDMLVISDEYELDTETILMKTTCPIIFQPDSIIIRAWKKLIALLSLLMALTYIFYLSLSMDVIDLYTLFIYFVTLVWILDVYIQISTAIKTKDAIITDISRIAVIRLSSIKFFVDIIAALPFEVIAYLMIGNMSTQLHHIMQVNRLVKSYRIFELFDISETSSANKIILMKYLKYSIFMILFVSNLSGIFYITMCPNYNCSVEFIKFLNRRSINIQSGSQLMVMCYYLTLQFITGIELGVFPVKSIILFLIAQVLYFLSEMYFIADVAAAETWRNKNKLRYHEFVANVNTVMKEWNFGIDFRKRVIKYCETQWEYDKAIYLLYQERLFSRLPFDLFKIGRHITFARAVGHITLFKDLPDETMAYICSSMERIILPPGEVITYSGEVCKEMYVIENGHCEMIAQSKTTAKILGPGDSFSVLETCLNVSTINTVISLTDCKLLSLTYENYLRALRYYPQVLTEINNTLATAIDWVAFDQLLNKESLDIESFTTESQSFNVFGYNLIKDTKEYEDFHKPYRNYYLIKLLKFILLRLTITPHGSFIKYWEISRCIFAFFTVMLNPITIVSAVENPFFEYLLIFLDFTAWVDIYLRHHISYFTDKGIEVKHPFKTAIYYWNHGFLVDFFGVIPFNYIVPAIIGNAVSAGFIVFLRTNRLLQFARIYNMFNYYTNTPNFKIWILVKYLLLVVILLNLISSFIINSKCKFNSNTPQPPGSIFSGKVYCYSTSWLSPKTSFQHPINPTRVYAYGVYFMTMLAVTVSLEGFSVFEYYESVEITFILLFWNIYFTYITCKIIASIMYRNVALVVYQNATKSLVVFMNYKKIDPNLKNEVIDHFEYVWHKKKGRNEQAMFKVFNIALHEDALYNIYGKVMEESTIFKGATKSFFKSLLLNVKHQIILKRGIISRVNDVHGEVYFLFKGQIEILGPDYNRLLTLPVGSVFGHLDNIPKGRQTISFIAKGHVEILTIQTSHFHSILSKYRGIRQHFKSLTSLNVDYLINANKFYNIGPIRSKMKIKTSGDLKKKRKYKRIFSCNRRGNYGLLSKVYKRNTAMKIWEMFIVGFVCYLGFTLEIYQKNTEDGSILLITILYLFDFLFLIKIYMQFHTTYDDERGLLVTDRVLIAKRYLRKRLGFRIDVITIIPFELVALFTGKLKLLVWSHARTLRLLRVFLVIDYFRGRNQKLNINVFTNRIMFLLLLITIILQFLVYVLFMMARLDPTLHHYNAATVKHYKLMTYLRQLKVLLNLFTRAQISGYKPNSSILIIMTIFHMILCRFSFSIFVAETCATLEIVLHNKSSYESQIDQLRKCMIRDAVSPPLLERVWLYVKLLWVHQKGVQFPPLLEEAPYYLREGFTLDFKILFLF